jgi:cobalt/nickel transport system permease protein
MLNYPISTETSGHVLGGLMAALIVGPWAATVIVSIVLAVQAIVFGDGGLYALGANTMNIAVVGVWAGWGFLQLVERIVGSSSFATNRVLRIFAVAAAGWISMQAAAISCASELILSGQGSSSELLSKIFSVHAWIGIGEGVLAATCAMVLLAMQNRGRDFVTSSNANAGRANWRMMSIAIVAVAAIAVIASPWASSFEDGLEWTLAKSNVTELQGWTVPSISWQLSDYTIPTWGSESLASLWLAGAAGLVCVMCCTWLLQKSLVCVKAN